MKNNKSSNQRISGSSLILIIFSILLILFLFGNLLFNYSSFYWLLRGSVVGIIIAIAFLCFSKTNSYQRFLNIFLAFVTFLAVAIFNQNNASSYSPLDLPIDHYQVTVAPKNISDLQEFNLEEKVELSKTAILIINRIEAEEKRSQSNSKNYTNLAKIDISCGQLGEEEIEKYLEDASNDNWGIKILDYLSVWFDKAISRSKNNTIDSIDYGLVAQEVKFKPLNFDAGEIVQNPKAFTTLFKPRSELQKCSFTPKYTITFENLPVGSLYNIENIYDWKTEPNDNGTETITASIENLEEEVSFIVVNPPFNRSLFKIFRLFIISGKSQELLAFCLGIVIVFIIMVLVASRTHNYQNNNNVDVSPKTSNQRESTGDKIEGDYIKGDYTDQSRNQIISGGTIDNDGVGAFNLGDINGTVANSINQPPSSFNSDKLDLENLLTQLQAAIADPQLSPEKQKQALARIQILAEAGQNPQNSLMRKDAQLAAVELLEIISQEVNPASELAKTSANVLPQILSFFISSN